MPIRSSSLYEYVERFLPAASAGWRVVSAQTENGFCDAVTDLLEEAVHHLERNAILFSALSEEGLSAVVIAHFNRYGLLANNEPNSNGHVDIYVENTFRRALSVSGEAKVYDGPSKHVDGLEQLLTYATGRCGYCFLLAYVKTIGVAAAMEKIRDHLDQELPERQRGPAADHHCITFALTSSHAHRSGRDVEVLHMGANLLQP